MYTHYAVNLTQLQLLWMWIKTKRLYFSLTFFVQFPNVLSDFLTRHKFKSHATSKGVRNTHPLPYCTLIGRDEPIAWPPLSPYINSLDFFVWRYLKSLLYSAAKKDEATLHTRILRGCQTIRTTPGIFLTCSYLNEMTNRSMR